MNEENRGGLVRELHEPHRLWACRLQFLRRRRLQRDKDICIEKQINELFYIGTVGLLVREQVTSAILTQGVLPRTLATASSTIEPVHALKVLEFGAIRHRLAVHCETTMGADHAERLTPFFEDQAVWDELRRTDEAHRFLSEAHATSLGAVRDLRDSLERAAKGGSMGGGELFQVSEALGAMRGFKAALQNRRTEFGLLWHLGQSLPELKLLEDQLSSSLDPSGEVKDNASQELATLRRRKHTATARIMEKVQSYTSGRSREYLSDPIYTIRDGRYVVPVKSEHRGKIKGIVHDTSGSGQTLFVEPEDVLQLGNALREIEAAEREEVRRILAELSSKVGKAAPDIIPGISAAGELDFLLAKARLAFEMKATMPQRWQGRGIAIHGGRHPLLNPDKVVPVDLAVGFEVEGKAEDKAPFQGLLITGPNTGGKTVAIKTVGLFVLMAQSGLMLPAVDVKLGPFTQVWADIGDEQSLQQSLSTFSGHVKNIAEALNGLKPGALVLFDEIGAGTDPAEGAALAKAILTTIQQAGAYVIASTHYGELKAFAYNTPGFRNAAMEFDVKSLRPTYRVLMGAPGASHALRIAERYGLPKPVVEMAVQGLTEEEQQLTRMLEQLEVAQKRARNAQSEADRRVSEVRRMEEKAREKLAEAEEIRKGVHARAAETIDETLREIRAEAAEVFEELKSAPIDARAQAKARERLKSLQGFGESVAKEFAPPAAPRQPSVGAELTRGMSVRVEGYNQPGTIVEEPKNGQVVVQMGPLKMTVGADKVSPAQQKQEIAPKPRVNLGFQRAQTAGTEIHLRAKRAEDALEELERFMDEAVLAGLPSVRIVHGKGEGVLRKVTQEFLKRSPNVERFRDGEAGEGGHGVTIAYLK